MTVRLILKQLLWAIGLWFLIAAVCFLSGFLRPSYLPYIALAMVYGWYFSIPILFAVVSIISFALHAVCAGNAAPPSRPG
jgi:hypothetical protein